MNCWAPKSLVFRPPTKQLGVWYVHCTCDPNQVSGGLTQVALVSQVPCVLVYLLSLGAEPMPNHAKASDSIFLVLTGCLRNGACLESTGKDWTVVAVSQNQ